MKSSKIEKALKEFTEQILYLLLDDKKNLIYKKYIVYINEIYNIKDISRWTSKKTLTDKVINAKRTNEQKILDALPEDHTLQMGDKLRVFFAEDKSFV